MWDDLLTAYPHLLIDNCASGGRRIDLETCSRSLPLWRSDNTCDMVGSDPARIAHAAIKNQLMSLGLNRYVPFSTVGQMGTTPYLFRSGFNGGIAFARGLPPRPIIRATSCGRRSPRASGFVRIGSATSIRCPSPRSIRPPGA